MTQKRQVTRKLSSAYNYWNLNIRHNEIWSETRLLFFDYMLKLITLTMLVQKKHHINMSLFEVNTDVQIEQFRL